MIAFVGSVFSPYYHWAGRREPENHVAFNIAFYDPGGNSWSMTERGRASLSRTRDHLSIGRSRLDHSDGSLQITFDEMALPWPGQRLLPKRMRGTIRLTPTTTADTLYPLDPADHHVWSPRFPAARVSVRSDDLAGGGWNGRGYHDLNYGDRPIEEDFVGWDWARGEDTESGTTLILYDALTRQGERRRIALQQPAGGSLTHVDMPERCLLPRGFWGVRGGIAADAGTSPKQVRRLEDSPFYTRSLVETTVAGRSMQMVQETLDCRRLANPFVRAMLPFRMPRRTRIA